LNHDERVELADKITQKFLDKYGDEVILGGIYGSTAKGTDVEDSDLEVLMIVKNESKADEVYFTYKGMPVSIIVQKIARVEKDIQKIEIDWPLKMGRLFTLVVTCGDEGVLRRFRELLEGIPDETFNEFLAKETPLCYEGLGKLKAVKERRNMEDAYLFVCEILGEFMLLTAIFNRCFINHAYLGGLKESYEFENLPKDYEQNAERLLLSFDFEIEETIDLADAFVSNFVSFLAENGIKVKEHTPLEEVEM
jgi:predicted nucleotidyltransferase